jgi:hypothetical protein
MIETIILIEREPLFELGEVLLTNGAMDTLKALNIDPAILLVRHVTGDYGDLCQEDLQANKKAVKNGDRIFSSYLLPPDNTKLWIITEWDRSVTTLLLPDEY